MQSKNSKNIALITTGGTISSALSDGYLSAGKLDLALKFEQLKFYKVYSPFTYLSENASFKEIRQIYEEVQKAVNEIDGPEGIIITYGTDALTFYASALSLLLYNINIPVVIVSADYPLDDERSNGFTNMTAAYEFIQNQGFNGVFAAYKNTDENVKIHFASRLNYTRAFDGYVSSAFNKICGYFDKSGEFILLERPCKYEGTTEFKLLLHEENEVKIRLVTPYVGLNYRALRKEQELFGFEIIHDSFHSGTVKTEGENSINQLNGSVIIAGGTDGSKYESLKYLHGNIRTVDNITSVSLYFKRALSLNMTQKEREEYLITNTVGEFF